MKNKKTKKGFTLVELLVVITILAVLATVSVIGYRNFTKKAQISNDTSLVTQLNLALQADEVEGGQAKTPSEALEVVEEAGYIVPKLTPTTAKYNIIWNQSTNRFALLDDKGEKVAGELASNPYENWTFVSKYEGDLIKKGYSAYLNSDFAETSIEAKAGVDVGKNSNISINYKNNGDPQEKVVMRTYGGVLDINAPKDTASHYGLASKVVVENIHSESYHEFGYVTDYIEAKNGHVVIESGASVSVLAVNGTPTVDQKDNSELFKVVPVGEGTTIDKTKIKVLDDVTVSEEPMTTDELSNMKYGGGEGNETHPYQLYTAAHLAAFAKDVNEGSFTSYVYVALCSDIDISGMAWEPIGNAEQPFNGSFDGQNHKIKGLTNKGYTASEHLWGITSNAHNSGYPYGFFGVIGDKNKEVASYADVVIKNLSFVNTDIEISSSNMLGILVGADIKAAKIGAKRVNENYEGNIVIENVVTEGTLKSTNGASVGGIAGKLETKGKITFKNCDNKAALKLSNDDATDIKAGGVVGFVANCGEVIIENCRSEGNMTIATKANYYVGGIISYNGNHHVPTFKGGLVSANIQIIEDASATITNRRVALVYGNNVTSKVAQESIDTVSIEGASCTVNGKAVTVKYL